MNVENSKQEILKELKLDLFISTRENPFPFDPLERSVLVFP